MHCKKGQKAVSVTLAVAVALGTSPLYGAPVALAEANASGGQQSESAEQQRTKVPSILELREALRQNGSDAANEAIGEQGQAESQTQTIAPNSSQDREVADAQGDKVAPQADEHLHGDEAFQATDALPTTSGSYYLTKDIAITDAWTVPAGTTISLCLNGHSIIADFGGSDGGALVHVQAGATLNLEDCDGSGVLKPGYNRAVDSGVLVADGATLNMYGGTIRGFHNGVSVGGEDDESGQASGGALNLYDGIISGNDRGVRVLSGAFNMGGGRISDNSGEDDGAGVYVGNSAFQMNGGTIANNTTDGNGGGVYLGKTTDAAVHGGTISGNSAASGAGVYLNGSTLAITGGSVSGNAASKLGGGIYVPEGSSLRLSGAPKVEGNTLNKASDNVFLSNASIAVVGELEKGASVGVSPANADGSTRTSAFTKGYAQNGNEADPSTLFSSDDEAYNVAWTDDGQEARLIADSVAGSYTVKFDANAKDAKGSMAEQEFEVGTQTALRPNKFTRAGYKFLGWCSKADGTGVKLANEAKILDLGKDGDTVTLYAQWEKNPATSKDNKPTAKTGPLAQTADPASVAPAVAAALAGGAAALVGLRKRRS